MGLTTVPRPRLVVLDTNVLFHLAEQDARAHNLVLRLIKLGFTPIVVQTTIQELGYAVDHDPSLETRRLASDALSSMREWGIQQYSVIPVGNAICDVVADVIANRGLIPEDERNDAYVAIETSICHASMLFTWDSHLLDASPTGLNDVLKTFDLSPIQVLHPKVILDKSS